MEDKGRQEQQKPAETPQQRLEKLWKQRPFWNEGPNITFTKPLPESMRVVMADTDFLVLRSPLPGAPIDTATGRPKDVPVAIFGSNVDPKYVEEEATTLGKHIQEGKVWYVPPEEIIIE